MEVELVKKSDKKKKIVYISVLIIIIMTLLGVSYAFFNYTREGEVNSLETGTIIFDYQDGSTINLTNRFPITESELDDTYKLTFTITAHNELTNGVNFNVYAIYGDDMTGKTRLGDDVMKFKFVAPANGDGFTISSNNYATANNLSFTNGKALIASGNVKNTLSEITKTYSAYLWVDADKLFVSSTTKRANNAEGNPSLADATAGTVTATRNMKNDSTTKTVTLYPANSESTGKIIYTTNEFTNAFYNIKIRIEAYDALS